MSFGGFRRRLLFGSWTLLLLSLFSFSVSPAFSDTRVFPGEYVVLPKRSAQRDGNPALSRHSLDVLDRSGLTLYREPGALALRDSSSGASTERRAVPYDPNRDACKRLLASGTVESCSPNFEYRVTAVPNDPEMANLWGLSSSGADAVSAWDVTTGSAQTVVAVIDTGVDYTHPDLARNMWVNTAEVAGNGRDDDNNGWIDDVHGINTFAGNGDPMDDNGHGTHVAGTIGAVGNNGVGVAGINWNVKIMALKFLGSSGSGSLADAIRAIDYMTAMRERGVNVKVSNNSWGGGGYARSLEDAVSRTTRAGILFVAAAGNEGEDNDSEPSYPANFELENVISVAAHDRNDNLAGFSNYGQRSVDIAAPGVDILSTSPRGGYRRLSGTSMATPHVAGAAALLLSTQPSLGPTEIIAKLLSSGRDLPTMSGVVSSGRKLDIGRLVRGESSPVPQPAPPSQPCTYSVEEVAFNPEMAIEQSPIVAQGDEFNFRRVELPFLFPFFESKVSAIDVSLNGLVYTKGAPGTPDYRVADSAPRNSIAALWSDLLLSAEPFGVRVVSAADKVTIFWHAQHYSRQVPGGVMAWLSLFPNGDIESHVSMVDPLLTDIFRRSATAGISGGPATTPVTYATSFSGSSQLIRERFAVRYRASCPQEAAPSPSPEASVSAVAIRGVASGRAPVEGRVFRGKAVELEMSGTGSGTFDLRLGFNGQYCDTPMKLQMTSGAAKLSGYLPANTPRRFRKLMAVADSAVGTARISGGRATARRRLSSRGLERFCGRLTSSMSLSE